jgi:predicted lipoprotein with Yx(FWY)xxD motif
MKSITVGLAALLLSTAASFAAEAWKEADVGGAKVYTDANGMTLYTYDKDKKDKSKLLRQVRHQLAAVKGRG